MAKPKKQEKKPEWKDVRIKANAVKRAARHAKRMASQKSCPKRGQARALRRYSWGVSKEYPSVLERNGYTMSMIARTSRPKAKPATPLVVSINGKPMGSMAEALFTVRELAAQRKATAAGSQAR